MAAQSTPTTDSNHKSLIITSIRNFLIGVVVFAAILFLLAGTTDYWQAWVFVIVFNFQLISQTVYLAIKDPALLERRKEVAPESESTMQRIVVIVGLLSLVGVILVSALDHRFGWSQMSWVVPWIGEGLLVLSFVIYYFVFMENSFAASSIQTFENQEVISTGLYAIVRHPKYVGDIIMSMGIPLALGSWWGLIFLIITFPMLMWRIVDEERLLKSDLPGYIEYTQTVRYRLVPYLW
jgi:protein-S-isoprenylcysteine O-methyltransferase Ste14